MKPSLIIALVATIAFLDACNKSDPASRGLSCNMTVEGVVSTEHSVEKVGSDSYQLTSKNQTRQNADLTLVLDGVSYPVRHERLGPDRDPDFASSSKVLDLSALKAKDNVYEVQKSGLQVGVNQVLKYLTELRTDDWFVVPLDGKVLSQSFRLEDSKVVEETKESACFDARFKDSASQKRFVDEMVKVSKKIKSRSADREIGAH
jgi:hypothetical protein